MLFNFLHTGYKHTNLLLVYESGVNIPPSTEDVLQCKPSPHKSSSSSSVPSFRGAENIKACLLYSTKMKRHQ